MQVSRMVVVLYVVSLVVVVVAVDVFFLRHNVVARLLVNIAIVLVFASCYLAFAKH